MIYSWGEKLFSKKWFYDFFLITVGSLIMAAGYVFFITPFKIVPGGIIGIAIIFHWITKGLFAFAPEGFPIGLMTIIINIPLAVVGIKMLGRTFGIKTIIGFVVSSVLIDVLTFFYGYEPLVKDAMLSSVFGGVLSGVGLGIIFKAKATTGGVDILGMLLAKRTHQPIGRLLIYIDSVIVCLALLAFKDWLIPLYSLIVIYITGKVIDTVIEGLEYNKTMFIISDKYEEIREKILFDLERGGTMINVTGMYENRERKLIFTNVNRRELAILQSFIKHIDPHAFVTVINANEIIGDGFKSFKEIG